MRKSLGILAAVLAMGLIFSVPAYAQGHSGAFASAGMGSGPNGFPTFGGGSAGGAGVGGAAHANLTAYPPTQFRAVAISGGDPSFAPSSFVTFEQAVAMGNATLAPQKTVAQAAAETSAARAKSRVEFVQDDGRRVVPLSR